MVKPVPPVKQDEIERKAEQKVDDELDRILLDDEEPSRKKPARKHIDDDLDDDFDDDDEYDDIDDEGNDKLDKAIMFIGIGIVTLIVVITVVVAVKLFAGGGFESTQEETSSSIAATTVAENPEDKDKVVVPSLVGKTEDEAKSALNSIGLGYKAVKQSSSTIPEGKIISQGTTAGTKVAKNSTITLSISSGPESSLVPNVVGIDQVEAANALESAGFMVTVKKAKSDTVEEGKVISQTPTAQSNSAPGTTVIITVSEGKAASKSVTVPNVVGLTEKEAKAKLEELGLVCEVKYQSSATNVKEGNVFGQSIKAGEKVTTGKTVTINVKKSNTTSETTAATKATTSASNATTKAN